MIRMNPGYLSLIIIGMMLILLACGWKEELLRGIPHKAILLFFICWIPLSFAELSLKGGLRINACYLLLAAVALLILGSLRSPLQAFHLASIGFLAGSFEFLLQQIYSLDPAAVVFRPVFDICASISVPIALLLRQPLQQIAGLTIGLIVGDGLFLYAHKGYAPFFLGHPEFLDKWWLTLLVTRSFSLGVQYAISGCQRLSRLWNDLREARRK